MIKYKIKMFLLFLTLFNTDIFKQKLGSNELFIYYLNLYSLEPYYSDLNFITNVHFIV